MIIRWNPNPIALNLELINIHIYWYGVLFAIGFILAFSISKYLCKRANLPVEKLDLLLMYVFVGTIIGARLFHVCFYQPQYYFDNPIEIFCIWKGGLASHGGTIGAILALFYFCRRNPEFNLIWMLDHLSIPTGLVASLIRIGNFMNSEIVGKPTSGDYGIIFERINDKVPLHPVQLYESISYFVIFLILSATYFCGKDKRKGLLFGFFVTSVFSVRLVLELFKSNQAEYEIAMNNWINQYINLPFEVSVGMVLSIPFIIVGLIFVILSFKKTNNLDRKN